MVREGEVSVRQRNELHTDEVLQMTKTDMMSLVKSRSLVILNNQFDSYLLIPNVAHKPIILCWRAQETYTPYTPLFLNADVLLIASLLKQTTCCQQIQPW